MGPLVSLVIPAYNHGSFVAEAVRSVLALDHPAIELIVLDDGSTDDTSEVLASLGGGFRWERQPNEGQARTLEKGWRLAQGEVLGYLSADDVLAPSAVRESVAELTKHTGAVAAYCDFNLIDRESRFVRRVATPDFNYREMLLKITCPPGPGAFFRRSAYESAGLPIVAAELDYVRDVVTPMQTFDPTSPVSIARAVKRFLGVADHPSPLLSPADFLRQIEAAE